MNESQKLLTELRLKSQSWQQVAERLEISINSMHRIRRGEHALKPYHATYLAEYLDGGIEQYSLRLIADQAPKPQKSVWIDLANKHFSYLFALPFLIPLLRDVCILCKMKEPTNGSDVMRVTIHPALTT